MSRAASGAVGPRVPLTAVLIFLAWTSAAPARAQEMPNRPPTLAAYLPEAIDTSADPCEDFYQYACGAWHETSPRPDDEAFWSLPFTQFARQVDAWVLAEVERVAAGGEERDGVAQRVGDHFRACMAAEFDDGARRVLQADLGVVDALREAADLPLVVAELQRRLPWSPNVDPLFFIVSSSSFWDGRDEVGVLVGPGFTDLPSPDDYLPEDARGEALLRGYRRHVAEMFRLAGWDRAASEEVAARVVDLEVRIAASRLRPGSGEEVDAGRGVMSVDELDRLMPNLHWRTFLRASGVPVVERVRLQDRSSFRSLDDLLAQTSLGDLRDLLRWNVIAARADDLGGEMRAARFDFHGRELLGVGQPPSRRRFCLQTLERDLPTELGRLFAREALDEDGRQRALGLFEEIREVVRERVAAADWLAEKTRDEALAKVDDMWVRISHPDTWPEDEHLVIRPDDHLGNVRRAGASLRKVDLARVGRPSSFSLWFQPVTWVGGFYSRGENAFAITAAGLLSVEDGGDPAALYGGLGRFIAHEMMHALDPGGRAFDSAGRHRDWWTAADGEAYRERAQCVASQYSKLEYVPGLPINGDYVLAEQVAELESWRIVWEAFRRWRETEGEAAIDEEATKRLMTVGAQRWCAEATVEEWRRRSRGGSAKAWAAPMVNGTVRNVPEFAGVFGCRPGQAMILPESQQCRIWSP